MNMCTLPTRLKLGDFCQLTSSQTSENRKIQGDRRKLLFSKSLFLQLESTILSIVGTEISLVLGHFGIWI